MGDIILGFDKGRQLVVDQRKNITVAYCNHFYTAEEENYNELHGKYSCIQVKAENFANGKGENATWAYVNLNPYEIRTIYKIAKTVFPVYDKMPYKKEFYHPFKDAYSSMLLEHSPNLNNPWVVTILQGKCDKNKKRIGNPLVKITVMYTDELFFDIWDTLYSRLRDWERFHYSILLKNGEPKTKAALNKQKNENKNNNSQPAKNNNHHSKNDTINNTIPPLAPPPFDENEIPFDEMPAYGSKYIR